MSAVVATLSQARVYSAGTTNSYSKGYISGGHTGASVKTTDRIAYSDDTITAMTTADLSTVRSGMGSLHGNGAYGYYAGGYSTVQVDVFDKIDYSVDTTNSMTSPVLSEQKRYIGSVSHAWLDGYFIGGYSSGTMLQTAEILNYSNDTLNAVTTANIEIATSAMISIDGNDSKGYLAGGDTGSAILSNRIYQISYETQSTSLLTSLNLQQRVSSSAGASDYYARGYFSGGNQENTIVDTTYRIDFTTNSLSLLSGAGKTLDQPRAGLSAVSRVFVEFDFPPSIGDGDYGYFAGGSTDVGSVVSTFDKIDYTTEAFVSTTAVLNVARDKQAGLSENITVGYFSGGNTGSYILSTERLTYSTDTVDLVTSLDLDVVTDTLGGISQGISKGYLVGGFTGAEVATTTKIIFSTETKLALTSANLETARNAFGTIDGNSYKGYVGGGSIEAGFGTRLSEIFYYTTEISRNSESASLTDGKRYLTGIGNRYNKGYFLGGIGEAYDSVDTIDFASDITSAIANILSSGRYALAGVNLTKGGYSNAKGFIGGGRSSSTVSDVVDKIVFTTDVISSLSPVVLSQARYALAAVSQITVPQPIYFARGTIVLSGTASFLINTNLDTQGTIVIYGSATVSTNAYAYTTSGGVTLSGAYQDYSFTLSLPVTYKVLGIINVSLPVYYSIAEEIYYGFRIEGECLDLTNCNGPFNEEAPECRKRSIVTIIARSPKEACEQLKKQNWIWPIKKFQKFTKPVYKNDEQALIEKGILNENCPQLEEVPFCYDRECADFCLAYDVIEVVTINSTAILENSEYVSSGSIIIFGGASYVGSIYGNYLHYPVVSLGTGATAGYFAGGSTGGSYNTTMTSSVYKITYATNTMDAHTSDSLSQARYGGVGCSGTQSKGYMLGGVSGVSQSSDRADKITYATGTFSVNASNMLTNRWGLGSVSKGNSYGYIAGGQDISGSTTYTSFERINYTTDGISALVGADLSSPARFGLSSLDGNDAKGYFSGGNSGSFLAYVTSDKITYSTETVGGVTSADLNIGRYYAASCNGNFFFGYITGGQGASGTISNTEKTNYGTEINEVVSSANLQRNTSYPCGISQGVSKGYFTGGTNSALSNLTYVLSYSTNVTSYTGSVGDIDVSTYALMSASPYAPYTLYPISGGPIMGGVATVTTVDVAMTSYYTGSGSVIMGGSATLPAYLGEQIQSSTMIGDIFYFVPYFTSSSGQSLTPQSTSSTIAQCGCKNLPLKFTLLTNLNTSSALTSFIQRSNLTFSPNLICYYDLASGNFIHTTHLQGRNADGKTTEKWTIIANINCNNDLDNFNQQFIWTLNILIKRYVGTDVALNTNLQIWMPQQVFCPSYIDNSVGFNLQVNVQTATCLGNRTTNLPNVFIDDRIELFNSVAWKQTPILSIISSTVP